MHHKYTEFPNELKKRLKTAGLVEPESYEQTGLRLEKRAYRVGRGWGGVMRQKRFLVAAIL
jgi:hypothetical protein